eukprot:TRINITY_DN1805_c0_g1_i4.p1 TRINITY_DN1805_c0_g1~~TRINITY_DN1805_c0_g1_i4.p1  ORF type:complete len:127 (-),score=23.76 TRINITY_DN1805_c0_g1_i4:57-437(-)
MEADCEEPAWKLWPVLLPSLRDRKESSRVLLGPSEICLFNCFPAVAAEASKSAHQSLKKGSLKKSSLPTVDTASLSPGISVVSFTASLISVTQGISFLVSGLLVTPHVLCVDTTAYSALIPLLTLR